MCKTDLVMLSLDNLSNANHWSGPRVQSLINAIADVCDEHLFSHTTFAQLMTDPPATHLKHISFNATEFANALQFRFQWSEKIIHPKEGQAERGLIGNGKCSIPDQVARHIRMADILAASSCFPGAFEPINFPTDFVTTEPVDLYSFKTNTPLPVGLMDGGIVDNQGIEPILLAEARMEHNRRESGSQDKDRSIDLIIVSDVASPYLEEYRSSIQQPLNWWRKLTPKKILVLNTLLLVLAIGGLVTTLIYDITWASVILSVFITLSVVLFALGRILLSLPAKFNVPAHFLAPLGKLLRLKLQVYETLILNRSASLLKLANSVFLKHVRGLNYSKVWQDATWENRRVMNAIFELRSGEDRLEKKLVSGKLPAYLKPSDQLCQIAKQAADMGTTLWFTPEELNSQLIDTIIACGQFTLCWNLLEYIYKIKKNPVNTDEAHKALLDAEDQLLRHWQSFQTKPFWLTSQYTNTNTLLQGKGS